MGKVQTFYGDIEVKGNILGMYPIDSIYTSVNSTSPASLFGGTWTKISETNGEKSYIVQAPQTQNLSKAGFRTWNYTGAYISVPANSFVQFSCTLTYLSADTSGIALATSSTSLTQSTSRWCEVSHKGSYVGNAQEVNTNNSRTWVGSFSEYVTTAKTYYMWQWTDIVAQSENKNVLTAHITEFLPVEYKWKRTA